MLVVVSEANEAGNCLLSEVGTRSEPDQQSLTQVCLRTHEENKRVIVLIRRIRLPCTTKSRLFEQSMHACVLGAGRCVDGPLTGGINARLCEESSKSLTSPRRNHKQPPNLALIIRRPIPQARPS